MPPTDASLRSTPYNCDVYGRGVRCSVPSVATLMWWMITPPKDDASYKPNHFALLVPRSDVPLASISVSDDERTDNLDKNTPVDVETNHAADNDTDDDDVNSTTSDDSDIEMDDDGDERKTRTRTPILSTMARSSQP